MEDWEDELEELTLKEERRQRNGEAVARHLAEQTQEERDARLARKRAAFARSLAKETKQEHDARLAKARDRRLKKDGAETEEDKAERLRRNRERVAKSRKEKKERRQNQPGLLAAPAPAASLRPTGMAPAMEVVPALPPLVLVPTATKVESVVPPPKAAAATASPPALGPSAAPAAAAASLPAAPAAAKLPFTLIRKQWKDEWFEGKVISSYWSEGRLLYRVLYSDGDDEDLEEAEVRRFTIANHLGSEGTASLAVPDGTDGTDEATAMEPVVCVEKNPVARTARKTVYDTIEVRVWYCPNPHCDYHTKKGEFSLKCPRPSCRKEKKYCKVVKVYRDYRVNSQLALLQKEAKEAFPETEATVAPAPAAMDPESFREATLHGNTDKAYWSEPAPPTGRGRRRRKRKYHHSSAGIKAKPPKNGWVCSNCLVRNSNDNATALPGLCPTCSPAHQNGTVRAAAVQGRARALSQQKPFQLDSEPEEDDGYYSAASEGSAYDSQDERRILKWRLKEQGDADTVYQEKRELCRKFIATYQKMDDDPKTIAQASKWHLFLLTPADIAATHVTFVSNLDLSDAASVRKTIGDALTMARNQTHAYYGRRFHNRIHFTLGPAGTESFVKYLQQCGVRVHRQLKEVDHPYDPDFPLRPVVINTHAKVDEEDEHRRPILTQIEDLLREEIPKIAGYLEQNCKPNQRNTVPLPIGYTAEDANGWDHSHGLGTSEPAIVGITNSTKYPPNVLNFFRIMGEYASTVLFDALVGNTDRAKLPSDLRRKWARFFAEELGSDKERAIKFLAEHMTLALGHSVDPHVDAPNCSQSETDWLMAMSATLDLSNCEDHAEELVAMAKKFGLRLSCLKITVLFYLRKICGSKTSMEERGHDIEEPASKYLLEDLRKLSVRDPTVHDHLDVDALGEPRLRGQFRDNIRHHENPNNRITYCGRFWATFERITKLFFFASSVHATWALLFKYPKLRTVRSLFQLCFLLADDINGQIAYFALIMKWLDGHWCDNTDEDAFQRQWDDCQDLYYMGELELFHLCQAKNKGWPSSRYFRYQRSKHLRLYDEEVVGVDEKGHNINTYSVKPNALELSRDFVNRVESLVYEATQRHPTNADDIARHIHHGMQTLGQFATTKAGHFVQYAALLGLTPPECFHYAEVSGTGTSGPTRYIKHAYTVSNDAGIPTPRPKDYPSIFKNMIKSARSCGFQLSLQTGEQHMCMSDRCRRNELSYDVIFEDRHTKQLQLFFQVIDHANSKTPTDIRYYDFDSNSWLPFFKNAGITPVHEMETMADQEARMDRPLLFEPDAKFPTTRTVDSL